MWLFYKILHHLVLPVRVMGDRYKQIASGPKRLFDNFWFYEVFGRIADLFGLPNCGQTPTKPSDHKVYFFTTLFLIAIFVLQKLGSGIPERGLV